MMDDRNRQTNGRRNGCLERALACARARETPGSRPQALSYGGTARSDLTHHRGGVRCGDRARGVGPGGEPNARALVPHSPAASVERRCWPAGWPRRTGQIRALPGLPTAGRGSTEHPGRCPPRSRFVDRWPDISGEPFDRVIRKADFCQDDSLRRKDCPFFEIVSLGRIVACCCSVESAWMTSRVQELADEVPVVALVSAHSRRSSAGRVDGDDVGLDPVGAHQASACAAPELARRNPEGYAEVAEVAKYCQGYRLAVGQGRSCGSWLGEVWVPGHVFAQRNRRERALTRRLLLGGVRSLVRRRVRWGLCAFRAHGCSPLLPSIRA